MKMKKLTLLLFIALMACTNQADGPELTEIFNGKDFSGWQVPENNIWWSVEDGILKVKSGPDQTGSILWTEKSYKDFIVQADFKMGEGTVDSGIFLREESQQIQIGESGSLKRDMTGSPYIPGKGYPVEAEGVADLLKMDDWNTIKARAVGNQYTVWLNGQEVMNYTSENTPEMGPIGIQLHPKRDMTIEYRNIMATEL